MRRTLAECTVRAVELKLKRMSPGEREAAMSRDDEDGYVLVKPLFVALPNSKLRTVDEALFPGFGEGH